MAWYEHNHMWDKAQEQGKYNLFVFDVKNSRKSGYFYPHIRLLLYRVYFKLKDLEEEKGIKILHTNEIFNKGDRGGLLEPFFFSGDLFGFTTLRGSISDEEVYQMMKDAKEELNTPLEFYYDNGYYETDRYGESGKKYFRGYCMQYLEDRCKKRNRVF